MTEGGCEPSRAAPVSSVGRDVRVFDDGGAVPPDNPWQEEDSKEAGFDHAGHPYGVDP